MATKGETRIDRAILRPGTPRAEIEELLGSPIASSKKHISPHVVTYQYFTGAERSYGRAAAYGALGFVTLGLSEFVTTPVEMLQLDKHIVEVVYDSRGRVKTLSDTLEKAPLEHPERMLDI